MDAHCLQARYQVGAGMHVCSTVITMLDAAQGRGQFNKARVLSDVTSGSTSDLLG
jgi:hypothetical protein